MWRFKNAIRSQNNISDTLYFRLHVLDASSCFFFQCVHVRASVSLQKKLKIFKKCKLSYIIIKMILQKTLCCIHIDALFAFIILKISLLCTSLSLKGAHNDEYEWEIMLKKLYMYIQAKQLWLWIQKDQAGYGREVSISQIYCVGKNVYNCDKGYSSSIK